jgi:hypothetical protein
MKKNILLLLVGIGVIVLILIIIFISNNKNGGSLGPLPIPTPVGAPKDSGGNALPDQNTSAQQHAQGRQDALVGELLNQLPYVGGNFSLYYNYSKDMFVLYINPNAKQQGEDEFNAFLTKNGIKDRSWIQSIFTTYLVPTPTPGAALSPTPAP